MIEIAKGIYKEQEDSDVLVVRISKEYFEKEAIMHAIHEYSHIYDTSMLPIGEKFVGVWFKPKDSSNTDEKMVHNFSNRVVDYQIRRDLDRESGHIRDRIVEYAYGPVSKK